MRIVPITPCDGFARGITESTQGCVRLYPHRLQGEGHFVALLEKEGNHIPSHTHPADQSLLHEIPAEYHSLVKDKDILKRKEKYYLVPPYDLPLDHLRILRSGLYLGEDRHGRFEPSQAAASAMDPTCFKNIIDLPLDDERILRYLKCETLDVRDQDVSGMVLVCVDGFPLGFGKVSNGILKNRYPANYRYQ